MVVLGGNDAGIDRGIHSRISCELHSCWARNSACSLIPWRLSLVLSFSFFAFNHALHLPQTKALLLPAWKSEDVLCVCDWGDCGGYRVGPADQ